MTFILAGRIIRLQVQTSSLKARDGQLQYFDPEPILVVDVLDVTRDGVAFRHLDGIGLDIHHARHPLTKNRGLVNSVSIGFTSHYSRMRERFGPHLSDGIAGENILVESDRLFSVDDIADGLVIVRDGTVIAALESVSVAHPCVEFSRFALQDRKADPMLVSDALRFLDGGMRGFYAVVPSDAPVRVAVGDAVGLRS